jgi:polar amino acid transport system substrate-binding protein
VLDATAERKQAVDFPEVPLLWYSLAVLARDDLAVKTWEDLNKPGLKLSCAQATTVDSFLTKNTPKADIQRFPGNVEAIAAFQSGRVDAVGMFHPPLLAARQKLGKGKLVVPTPAESVASSVAARKGDVAFVAWIDKAVGEYYRSGQTEKWYEQSLSDFGLDPKTVPPIMKEMIK